MDVLDLPDGTAPKETMHYGMTGVRQPVEDPKWDPNVEWWSVTETLPEELVEKARGDQIADRYGLRRWVWTDDEGEKTSSEASTGEEE